MNSMRTKLLLMLIGLSLLPLLLANWNSARNAEHILSQQLGRQLLETAQVKQAEGITLGLLVFEVSIHHVKELLAEEFNLGQSGRITLTSLDGVEVVNDKKNLEGAFQGGERSV